MENQISEKHLAWLESRKISGETAVRMQIYSGQHRRLGDDKWEVVAHPNGEVLCFPFLRHGEIIGEKYRGAQKRFYQRPGAKRIFWNADVLDDPALHEGRAALLITEGELDALAAIEAGYPFSVSVPDGAPAELKPGQDIDDPDPANDPKYEFIINDLDALKKIKRIIVATDDDGPGRRLAEELVRRLGRARCLFIDFPEDSKDLNQVLELHGRAEVIRLINTARPYPVSGVYRYSELPNEPDLNPVSTGFGRLDPLVKVFYPSLMTITGFAGSGKSSFANQLVAHLAINEGWPAAIASFEMRVKPFISVPLMNAYKERYPKATHEQAEAWLDNNFVFVAPEPSDEDDAFDIQWLIDKAEVAVIRYGIRVLLIDPWNELDLAVRRGENQSDYVGRAIRALKRFGRQFEVMVVIVAHPTKKAAEKEADEVSLYDVSDSAHFSNKSDFGIVMARINPHDNISSIMVRKVRYQPETGSLGEITVSFDQKLKLFSQ